MTPSDIPAGMRLKEIAGWNQTEADWKRFLDASPQGCFVAEADNKICGTVATIVFENRFAWIGMVLVDPEYRSRGIGTALLERAIEHLDSLKIPTLKLDATPQGKPLYEKLGFVSEYEIERWVLRRGPAAQPARDWPQGSQTLAEHLFAAVLKADQPIFGANRSFLLRSLDQHAPGFTLAVSTDGQLRSYALGRRGTIADHLGPWMAKDKDAAHEVLNTFLSRSRPDVFVDWVKTNMIAGDLLKSFGFAYSRSLTRMYRGTNDFPGQPDRLCAILGPEFG